MVYLVYYCFKLVQFMNEFLISNIQKPLVPLGESEASRNFPQMTFRFIKRRI